MHFFHFCIALFFKKIAVVTFFESNPPWMFFKKVLQICKNWLDLNQKGFAIPNKNQKKSEKEKGKKFLKEGKGPGGRV
jgi:hypothetical protein